MSTYLLHIHSYDVLESSGNVIARHTGISLITTDDNGTVTIEKIDFMPTSPDSNKAIIAISSGPAEKVVLTHKDNPTITQEAYWNSGDTTFLAERNVYMSAELASGQEALTAFKKIKAEAALTNWMDQLDYDAYSLKFRVCNTATTYWGETYIPNFDKDSLYNSLPNGTIAGYAGKDDDYVNATSHKQGQQIQFITQLVNTMANQGKLDSLLIDQPPYIAPQYQQILQPLLESSILYNRESKTLNSSIVVIFRIANTARNNHKSYHAKIG